MNIYFSYIGKQCKGADDKFGGFSSSILFAQNTNAQSVPTVEEVNTLIK